MAGQINIAGNNASVNLQGNDTITTDQTFTFPATGGTLLVSDSNIGLWERTGTVISPATAGDGIAVDGRSTFANGVVVIATDGGMNVKNLSQSDNNWTIQTDGSSSFAGNSLFGPATGGGKVNIEGMGTTAGELSIANPTGSNSFNCFRVISQGNNKVVITQGGTISAANTTIQPVTSERRLKENIVTVDAATSWSTIKDTPYYAYNFIGNESITYGPMADEVPAEMKVATDQTDDVGVIHTFDNGMMQARLYTALQTALTRIETLEATNTALEARLTALEGGAS